MADIAYEKHGAVRLITINRADKMNSLDFAANEALIDIWRTFDQDDDARVAVITGAGDKSFLAGADLKTYTLNFAQAAAPFLFGLAVTEWGSGALWLSGGLGLGIFAALCLISSKYKPD